MDISTFRETNLKVRQPLSETHELRDNQDMLAKFDGDYNYVIALISIQIFLKVMLNVNLQITDYTSL